MRTIKIAYNLIYLKKKLLSLHQKSGVILIDSLKKEK